MPAERLPMRKVREVLRLKHACGASDRLICKSLAVSQAPADLYRRGFRLYEAFRPSVPTGEGGWGAKGELDLAAIHRLKGS